MPCSSFQQTKRNFLLVENVVSKKYLPILICFHDGNNCLEQAISIEVSTVPYASCKVHKDKRDEI